MMKESNKAMCWVLFIFLFAVVSNFLLLKHNTLFMAIASNIAALCLIVAVGLAIMAFIKEQINQASFRHAQPGSDTTSSRVKPRRKK